MICLFCYILAFAENHLHFEFPSRFKFRKGDSREVYYEGPASVSLLPAYEPSILDYLVWLFRTEPGSGVLLFHHPAAYLRVVHRIHSTLNICVPLRLIYVIALLPIKGPLYHRIKFVCVQMYLLYPVHITCMMLVCGRYLPSLPAISGDFPVLYKILSTSFLSKAQTICLPENDLYL